MFMGQNGKDTFKGASKCLVWIKQTCPIKHVSFAIPMDAISCRILYNKGVFGQTTYLNLIVQGLIKINIYK